MHISIRQLFTLHAIVNEGSFKSAAEVLHRSHPSILSAMKKLEEELGFDVFDRSGYRVELTPRGREFYKVSQPVIEEYVHLRHKVAMLQSGGAPQINIVVGDVTPPEMVSGQLRDFVDICPNILINLYSENLMGPQERLFDDEVDLIIHHVDTFDTRLEVIPLGEVKVVPVAAPGYFKASVSRSTTYDSLKEYAQCIIRCTATHSQTRDYFIVDGSPKLTVDSQIHKKHLIASGMAWGHMPEYLVKGELESGTLVAITGKHIKEHTLTIAAARLADKSHSATVNAFWEMLGSAHVRCPGTKGVVDLACRR